NETLREQGTELAARTFNRPGFPLGKIELRDVAPGEGGILRWEALAEEDGERAWALDVPGLYPSWFGGVQDMDDFSRIIEFLPRTRALAVLAGVRAWLPETMLSGHEGSVFLPASRTGFMLLYRSLAQQLVGDVLVKTGAPRRPVPDLTAPAIDFVNLLVGL